MAKQRKYLSGEIKRQAVDEHVSGKRRVTDIAAELGAEPARLYKRRVHFSVHEERTKIEEIARS